MYHTVHAHALRLQRTYDCFNGRRSTGELRAETAIAITKRTAFPTMPRAC